MIHGLETGVRVVIAETWRDEDLQSEVIWFVLFGIFELEASTHQERTEFQSFTGITFRYL